MIRLFERIRKVLLQSDNVKMQLFAFLASGEEERVMFGGERVTREHACQMLQDIIPTEIKVMSVRSAPVSVVASAPHVSFDNWSEYFCTRVAKKYGLGWVIARNFRDQDPHTIPMAIGRHIHVNRPTESVGPRRQELQTDRAVTVHEQYISALREASGKGSLPFDLLLEFHSHHRTPYLEVASSGLSEDEARRIVEDYANVRGKFGRLPDLRIEPLHSLRMTADKTKREGSLRPEVARIALHMEIPREGRRSEETRHLMCQALFKTLGPLLNRQMP